MTCICVQRSNARLTDVCSPTASRRRLLLRRRSVLRWKDNRLLLRLNRVFRRSPKLLHDLATYPFQRGILVLHLLDEHDQTTAEDARLMHDAEHQRDAEEEREPGRDQRMTAGTS